VLDCAVFLPRAALDARLTLFVRETDMAGLTREAAHYGEANLLHAHVSSSAPKLAQVGV
jgi:hypothetical protein